LRREAWGFRVVALAVGGWWEVAIGFSARRFTSPAFDRQVNARARQAIRTIADQKINPVHISLRTARDRTRARRRWVVGSALLLHAASSTAGKRNLTILAHADWPRAAIRIRICRSLAGSTFGALAVSTLARLAPAHDTTCTQRTAVAVWRAALGCTQSSWVLSKASQGPAKDEVGRRGCRIAAASLRVLTLLGGRGRRPD
jgi:hypothetical protein